MGRARWILAAAGVVGLTFDMLFWGHAPGISVPLFAGVLIGMLLVVLRMTDARPHPYALGLLIPAALLLCGPAVREEPMTRALTMLTGFGLLGLFAASALDGQWLRYGAREHLRVARRLTAAGTAGGMRVVAAASAEVRGSLGPSRRRIIPVVRGVALAIPILSFFGVLLGSADPVFAARVGDAFAWLTPAPATEMIPRFMLVLFVTYGIAGIYAFTVRPRPQPVAGDKPILPFLGTTESSIVLGSVNLLFAAFVAVQVRYLFGGAGHLVESGLTFAQYARRGFVELVVVAAASLVLLLVLAAGTRRGEPLHKRLFSALAAILTILVLVILASSFLRLQLYEEAFGFTRIRTYVHVFMGWLGLLLVTLLVLEFRQALRWFTGAMLVAAVGFVLTLQAINVDGFIAERNIARVPSGAALDGHYLANVSVDAVPALVEAARTAPTLLRIEINSQLACHAEELTKQRGWQSMTLSAVRARNALHDYNLAGAECEPSYR